ncbi:MAG TPA: hypothetical protein VIL95_08905 [Bacillota bacterium]
MPDSLENISAEQAVAIMHQRIGHDGTVALLTLLRHSQEAVLQHIDARLAAFEQRMNQRFEAIDRRFEAIDRRFEAIERRFEAIDHRFEDINNRIDRTVRFTVMFCLSLLGLVAAVATGLATLGG